MTKVYYILLLMVALLAVQAGQALSADQPATLLAPPLPSGNAAAVDAKPAPAVGPLRDNQEKKTTIGFVDMEKALKDSAMGKAAFADLKARGAKYKSQIDAKQKQLEKQKKDIEAKAPSFTPQQRVAKAKEFQKKVEDFQKFVQKVQKDMQEKENQSLGRIYDAVQAGSEKVAKAGGYAAVVAKREILYIGNDVEIKDVTDDVIKVANAEKPRK
jgi:outer membrane protein